MTIKVTKKQKLEMKRLIGFLEKIHLNLEVYIEIMESHTDLGGLESKRFNTLVQNVDKRIGGLKKLVIESCQIYDDMKVTR
jgi:hypothetical protein